MAEGAVLRSPEEIEKRRDESRRRAEAADRRARVIWLVRGGILLVALFIVSMELVAPDYMCVALGAIALPLE